MRRWRPRPGLAVLAGSALLLLAGAGELHGQFGTEECEFVAPSGDFQSTTVGASTIVRVQTPNLVCQDGVRIRSDSLRFYETSQYYELFGNVRFQDPDRVLLADDAQYFRRQARLQAQGDVELTRRSDGTVVTGQNLTYLQATPQRPEDELTVTGGRPHAVLMVRPRPVEPDTAGGGSGDPTSPGTSTAASGDPAAPDTAAPPVPDTAPDLPADTAPAPPADTAAIAAADTVPGPPADTAAIAAADTADALPVDTAPPLPVDSAARPPDPDSTRPDPGAGERAAPADPAPEPVPYEVDADEIEFRGESYFRATGRVVITRDSLEAFGDEAVYDQGPGTLLLTGNARMVDEGYTLEGQVIEAVLPGESIREVEARREGVLTGSDLDIRAPTVRLFLEDGALVRLVALRDSAAVAGRQDELGGAPLPPAGRVDVFQVEHPARAVARAQDVRLVADSLDVALPGEVLESLLAIGDARAENLSRDSLNTDAVPETARNDWIEGDEVEALFEPTAPEGEEGEGAADGTEEREFRMESLVARGDARSLYRMMPQDTTGWGEGTDRRLAIHYVTGDTIVLNLWEGEVESMDVIGRVRGVHWEPPPGRPGVARPAAVPDSVPTTTGPAGAGEGS